MGLIANFFNRIVGGGVGAPVAQSANAPSSGAVFSISRLLGSSSTLSLITGTNSNLTLSGTTINATSAIVTGNTQVAVVREVSGLLAVEYPVTFTGTGVSGITLTLTDNATLIGGTNTADSGPGAFVASIGNVPAGVTPVISSPTDGSLLIAGNPLAGWKIVKGFAPLAIGNTSVTVTASGANSVTSTVTVAQGLENNLTFVLGAAIQGQSTNWTYYNKNSSSTLSITGVSATTSGATATGTFASSGTIGVSTVQTLSGAPNSPKLAYQTVAVAGTKVLQTLRTTGLVAVVGVPFTDVLINRIPGTTITGTLPDSSPLTILDSGDRIGFTYPSLTNDSEYINLSITENDGSTTKTSTVGIQVVKPSLFIVGPLLYNTATATGAVLGYINGVPNGVTPTISPNDGRVVIGGNQSSGWRLERGSTAAVEGTCTQYTLAAGSTVQSKCVVNIPVVPTKANFLPAALKIIASRTSPRTVTLASGGGIPTVTQVVQTNSPISGSSIPTTAQKDVPDGLTGPHNSNSLDYWIVTKKPGINFSTGNGMIYEPGRAKRFLYDGRKFDFKNTTVSNKSFSIYYSEDQANGWKAWKKLTDDSIISVQGWTVIDSQTAALRAYEVIGEDESSGYLGGFNFETGYTVSAFPNTNYPVGMMMGDSYVFPQGSSQYSQTRTGCQATKGGIRLLAQYLGALGNGYNHGLRTNGWANDQGGVQSFFHERMDMAGFAELTRHGTLDYLVVPGSINDYGKPNVQTLTSLGHQKIKAMLPNTPYCMPVGFAPPDVVANGTSTLVAYKAAFEANFGSSSAAQLANGAIYIDFSPTGENICVAGAIGSSANFPGSGNNLDGVPADTYHPNATGYAVREQLIADRIYAWAVAYNNAYGSGSSTNYLLNEDGTYILNEDGSKIILD